MIINLLRDCHFILDFELQGVLVFLDVHPYFRQIHVMAFERAHQVAGGSGILHSINCDCGLAFVNQSPWRPELITAAVQII